MLILSVCVIGSSDFCSKLKAYSTALALLPASSKLAGFPCNNICWLMRGVNPVMKR